MNLQIPGLLGAAPAGPSRDTARDGAPTEPPVHGPRRPERNLHFRPIEPKDEHRLQRFHRRLSPQTVHLRFHAAKQELSTPLAQRFTRLDGHDDVAWLATTGTRGRIVGVARYFRLSPTCAEVAFVVEDAYQGHGVGRRLMAHLRQSAIENGITTLVADVLPGNTGMLRLLEEAGPAEMQVRNGVCEVRVSLTGEDRGTAQ